MDDSDLDLGDWDTALAHEEVSGAGHASSNQNDAFDLDLDLSLGEWGLAEGPVSQNEAQNVLSTVDPPIDTVAATEHMYGSVQDVSLLGTELQKGLFANFSVAVKTGACTEGSTDTFEDALESEFVLSTTLKSRKAQTQSIGYAASTLKRGLIEYACTLLFGAGFLIGAFLLAWSRLFTSSRQFQPIIAIWKRKYDETPLKLRVREHNQFFGTKISETEDTGKAYLHSKIFRIESSLRFSVFVIRFSKCF